MLVWFILYLVGIAISQPPDGQCPSPIPESECLAGTWPDADKDINGGWLPSRSTHYGGTSGGACGFGNTPNCWNPGNPCPGVPDVIANSPYAGLYTAPQGNYYAQLGKFPDDYLSCGECMEIRCVDTQCTYRDPITVQIADACPCFCNTKWCCSNYSDCTELGPDLDGHPHCGKSPNGVWDTDSLHLDLSDYAMSMLSSGSKTSGNLPGVINTMFRRVSCPAKGNIYLQLSQSVSVAKNCYTVYPQPPRDCFYYLSTSVINVVGYGAVESVSVNATIIQNGALVTSEVVMRRDPDSPSDRPQEQFGAFVSPQNVAIFFPINFKLTNRLGKTLYTKSYDSADTWPTGLYIDTGVQYTS